MKSNQNYRVLLGDDGWSRMIRHVVNFLEKFRINRKYKDRLFVKLFQDKKNMLELYNALNKTAYTNEEDLIITTIDDAVYMGMKNDCSFIVNNQLNLYEHQSTFCANMPLRGLIYLVSVYQTYVVTHNYDIYGTKLIKLPAPRLIVFYNGTDKTEDQIVLKLSDSFDQDDSCLECKAVMYNVNFGHNQELMRNCKTLSEYSYFIECIRRYERTGYTIKIAVDMATKECIERGILSEFLLKNRSEVIDMLLTEYDEKKHMKMVRRDAYEDGKIDGKAEGIAVGKAEGIAVGKAEGIVVGKAEGIAIGKAESILELLEDYGQPTGQLRQKIMNEKDLDVLKEWHKYATHVSSIEEFEDGIK